MSGDALVELIKSLAVMDISGRDCNNHHKVILITDSIRPVSKAQEVFYLIKNAAFRIRG